jgi:hypothetical protein
MAKAEHAIEVERPVAVVYEHLSAMTDVEITDRIPGEMVAWHARDDSGELWRASLIALSPKRTRVDLAVEHEADTIRDRAAEAFGALDRRVTDDLGRLKAEVEANSPPPE